MSSHTQDILIFTLVVLGRFIIPLFIPRYPLPAIVAAMILDAADQSIFQSFTNLNLDHYQSYDKALDVYYLAIAYIATLRNWTHYYAYKTGRFLWYYRLVGATLFELSGYRVLLLIFPNTWEYYFDWYEGYRLRWNPLRLTKRTIIKAAAFIWIFIKLPQEYWIHVAELDTTDLIKEKIFGVPTDTSWGDAISQNLWIIPVVIAILVGLFFLARWIKRRLPPADWKLSFDADAHPEADKLAPPLPASEVVWHTGVVEKIVLVGLVGIIFGLMLPNTQVTNLQLVLGVAIYVVVNAAVSHWFSLRGHAWRSVGVEFVSLAAMNTVLGALYLWILPSFDGDIRFRDLLFFSLLFTLIVTLFDRYRPIHDRRVAAMEATPGETDTAAVPV